MMRETVKRLVLSVCLFYAISKVSSFIPFLYNIISYLGFIVITSYFSWKMVRLYRKNYHRKSILNPKGKAIFITGCDSGFGHKLAVHMDSQGFIVFAGCLSLEGSGARSLIQNCSPQLKVLKIDVRRDEDARDAAAFVEKHLGDDEKLWAVVNNAGIIDYCGVDLGPEGVESYSRQMDVNVFGVIRVTKSFLPLIRKTRGARIILVGSVAGRFIAPAMTGYSMSKFALRAFAEGLRREMSTFGVQVSVVEPIFYKTAVSDGALALRQFKSNWDSTPDSIRKEYGETRFQVMYNAVDLFTRTAHKRVEDVVETLSHAICILPEPEPYFRVCYTLETVLSLIEDLPEEIVDCISNEYVGPPLLRAVAAYNSYLDI